MIWWTFKVKLSQDACRYRGTWNGSEGSCRRAELATSQRAPGQESSQRGPTGQLNWRHWHVSKPQGPSAITEYIWPHARQMGGVQGSRTKITRVSSITLVDKQTCPTVLWVKRPNQGDVSFRAISTGPGSIWQLNRLRGKGKAMPTSHSLDTRALAQCCVPYCQFPDHEMPQRRPQRGGGFPTESVCCHPVCCPGEASE